MAFALVGRTVEHFELLGPLGAGAMSEVSHSVPQVNWPSFLNAIVPTFSPPERMSPVTAITRDPVSKAMSRMGCTPRGSEAPS